MKLHHDPEFVAWFKRPFRSQPQGGEITLDYASLCWSVTFNTMFDYKGAATRFETFLARTHPSLLDEYLDNPERFKEIFEYYGTGDISKLDLPVMVNLLDGNNPELWQEGMSASSPCVYQLGKPTLLDYLMRVSGCRKTSPARTTIIRDWIRNHGLELANTLGQPDALFYDIPARLLREIATKLKPVAVAA